jgi:hypothetical protein
LVITHQRRQEICSRIIPAALYGVAQVIAGNYFDDHSASVVDVNHIRIEIFGLIALRLQST